MNSFVYDIKEKLKEFSEIQNLYTVHVPFDNSFNSDVTSCLVQEAGRSLEMYGSMQFYQVEERAEVTIWYAIDIDIDIAELEDRIFTTLIDFGVDIYDIRSHIYDPDTNQLYFSFYVKGLRAKTL